MVEYRKSATIKFLFFVIDTYQTQDI